MKFGVVQFPGSNCDDDACHAVGSVIGQPVELVWHQSHDISGFDAIVLPGGFAFGDYLRTGAIARFSPVMNSVGRFARSGGLVLGICNGFQILLEAGLLPGAMMRNKGLRFLCRQVHIRVESTNTPFTCSATRGQVLQVPIAHMEGNYFCDSQMLADLERNDQIIFRYVHPDGSDAGDPAHGIAAEDDRAANPNGALAAIAGICNRDRNVLGMMPHPERAVEAQLGSNDGLVIFQSMLAALVNAARATA
ncbi:MAG TPA: phosphoribosylformylglycinamidine synthase subunit PurQ [Candidatus Acidoferrum sp.]|nr:phosphoribosylformylglycinamidine synthase subunit PurQ [Candidatus Acidoferrum sp.]